MDDQHWSTPDRPRLLFRVPAGVVMVFVGAVAAYSTKQPLAERAGEENDLAPLLGFAIEGAVAVFGLLLLLSGVRAIRRAKRVAAQGLPATGVVTEHKRLGGDQGSGSNYRTTIVLDAPVDGVTEARAVGALLPVTGDKVLVRLDPEDPSYAVVEGYRSAPLPATTDPQILAMRAGKRGVYFRRR